MKLEVLFACIGGLGNERVDDVGLKTESLKPGSSFFQPQVFDHSTIALLIFSQSMVPEMLNLILLASNPSTLVYIN